ncbi:cytochrome c [Bacillaceae bacterium IKA-2]|nr:cytochrome c [Bacillaceae bacterium IKA-2]
MKKLLMAMIGAVLVLGACGGNDEAAPDEAPAAEETPAGGETTPVGDYDAAAAEASYSSCIGCHGGNLEGQGANPAIAGLSYEEVLTAIEVGPGTMPAGMVTGDAAENLAAWIAAQ